MARTISKTSAETRLDSLDPATSLPWDGRHLREIGRALTALEQAETDPRGAVEAARAVVAAPHWADVSRWEGRSAPWGGARSFR